MGSIGFLNLQIRDTNFTQTSLLEEYDTAQNSTTKVVRVDRCLISDAGLCQSVYVIRGCDEASYTCTARVVSEPQRGLFDSFAQAFGVDPIII